HFQLDLEAVDVASDGGNSQHLPGLLVPDEAIAGTRTALYAHLVPALCMADIADCSVVVLAPEKRHGGYPLAGTTRVARGSLALAFRHHPVFYANGFRRAQIRPARDISGREDARGACLQITVDGHASIDSQPRAFRETSARPYTDAHYDEIAI